ncbi:ABC transporter substrate-binding protein [Ruminococcaceae bacterium OttesenSCG-928-A11]|nr:ABC transporter substrate-binding protein [Oscillospiraceae bacterium OttesenSCG-928-F05]MDL2327767.1 ABC transporter substrate-binding protein [Ruminococcaceae bacterium OttesenSCG-928-A11]
MKSGKIVAVLLSATLLMTSFFGCGQKLQNISLGEEPPQRVVALSSSLAEIWLLAGGHLVGTTSDTVEREFSELPKDITVVGTVKEPGLEAILDLRPDFVILSADLAGHLALGQALTNGNIPHIYIHVETFPDYYDTLEFFCSMTGNTELFEQNGEAVKEHIDRLLAEYEPPSIAASYLLLRVHSSGGKVIAQDHVACDILGDLGAINIAAQNQSLLSDLSLEVILEQDPDFIFVVTMGEEAVALQTLEQIFAVQPAWQKLSAVGQQRVHILPKALFHYKPNVKWGEAYETLIQLLTA